MRRPPPPLSPPLDVLPPLPLPLRAGDCHCCRHAKCGVTRLLRRRRVISRDLVGNPIRGGARGAERKPGERKRLTATSPRGVAATAPTTRALRIVTSRARCRSTRLLRRRHCRPLPSCQRHRGRWRSSTRRRCPPIGIRSRRPCQLPDPYSGGRTTSECECSRATRPQAPRALGRVCEWAASHSVCAPAYTVRSFSWSVSRHQLMF